MNEPYEPMFNLKIKLVTVCSKNTQDAIVDANGRPSFSRISQIYEILIWKHFNNFQRSL